MENYSFYAVLRKMLDNTEVARQRCSWGKNTHAEVRFQ